MIINSEVNFSEPFSRSFGEFLRDGDAYASNGGIVRTFQSGWSKTIPNGNRRPGTLSPGDYNEEHALAAGHVGAVSISPHIFGPAHFGAKYPVLGPGLGPLCWPC